MRGLRAIIAGTILGIGLLCGGCATGYRPYPTIQDKKQENSKIMLNSTISFSEMQLIGRGNSQGDENIEGLIERSEDYIDYIKFQKNYSDYPDEIISNLKNGRLNQADETVRELASKLERDDNPYAKTQLGIVKNFTYTIKQYYTAYTGVNSEYHQNEWNEDVADGLELMLSPLHLLINGNMGSYNSVRERRVKKKFFDEIEINPFRGTKRTIRLQVEVSESEIKAEQEKAKQLEARKKEVERQKRVANRSIDDIKAVVRKYESGFSKIKTETNPKMSGYVTNSTYKTNKWVDDSKIVRDIQRLYKNISEEGNHPLYEPLKREIREFEYHNIGVETIDPGIGGLYRDLSGKKVYYKKKVTEFYRVNPYKALKWNVPGYERLIGKSPGNLPDTLYCKLQSFFEQNKPRRRR